MGQLRKSSTKSSILSDAQSSHENNMNANNIMPQNQLTQQLAETGTLAFHQLCLTWLALHCQEPHFGKSTQIGSKQIFRACARSLTALFLFSDEKKQGSDQTTHKFPPRTKLLNLECKQIVDSKKLQKKLENC